MRRLYSILALLLCSLVLNAQSHAVIDSIIIKGQVLDEKKEPLVGATLHVFESGLNKGGTATDIDGNFLIRKVRFAVGGKYELQVQYPGFKTTIITNISTDSLHVPFQIKMERRLPYEEVYIQTVCVPMIQPFGHGTTTITAEQIEKMAR